MAPGGAGLGLSRLPGGRGPLASARMTALKTAMLNARSLLLLHKTRQYAAHSPQPLLFFLDNRKSGYYQLAALVRPEDIDSEVREVLDGIWQIFQAAQTRPEREGDAK